MLTSVGQHKTDLRRIDARGIRYGKDGNLRNIELLKKRSWQKGTYNESHDASEEVQTNSQPPG